MYAKTMLALLAALAAVIALQTTKRHVRVPGAGVVPAPPPGADVAADLCVFERKIPELRLKGVPLRDAVDVLRAKTGANFAVRWRLLNREDLGEGTDRGWPVEVTLRDVTLGDALRAIGRTADPPLQYGLENGIVVITGQHDAQVPTTAGVYNVWDLLPPGESPGLVRRTPGTGLFGNSVGKSTLARYRTWELVAGLTLDAEGPHYEPWRGRLAVVGTPDGHRRVESLLRALRGGTPAHPGSRPSGAPATAPAPGDGAEALNRRVREIRMDGVSVDAALDQLRDAFNANIVARWADLIFIDRTAANVHLRLSDVKLSQALDVLCAALSGETDEQRVGWREDEGVILLATEDRLIGAGLPRVFDVRDLIDEAVASRRRLGDTRPAIEDPASGEAQSPADWEGHKLRQVIVESFEPTSWQSDGNRYASGVIHYWSGRLIVSNRPSVEKRVGEFLQKLRESRAEESKKQ